VSRTVLHDDERGYVVVEGNELTVGSKIDDPPKVRLTSPTYSHGGGGGAVSFNSSPESISFGDRQTEMAMIRVEQAEDVRGQVANPKAEINFLLNDGGTTDANMQKPFAFVWNTITQLRLAFVERTDTMWAPSGLFFTQQQADGNFVTYRITTPFDKSANPKAVWSAWTGFIG